jgi:hypothetical protein
MSALYLSAYSNGMVNLGKEEMTRTPTYQSGPRRQENGPRKYCQIIMRVRKWAEETGKWAEEV